MVEKIDWNEHGNSTLSTVQSTNKVSSIYSYFDSRIFKMYLEDWKELIDLLGSAIKKRLLTSVSSVIKKILKRN